MSEETITAPSVEGVPEGTGSQAADSTSQEVNQSKETDVSQVETNQQHASSERPERPKPSDFYRDRKDYRQLKDTVALQQEQLRQALAKIDQLSPGSSSKPQIPEYLTQEYLASKPTEALLKFRDDIIAMVRKEQQETLPKTFDQLHTQREVNTKIQEALKTAFPKGAGEDPEKVNRVQEILLETGLNSLSETKPDVAMKLALMLWEKEQQERTPQRQVSPKTIGKNLMGATVTGQNSGGAKMLSLGAVREEKNRLQSQLDADPNLRYDDAFKAKWANVQKAYSDLHKQETGKAA